jgi:starvation-inducible DNA-binding protein
MSKGKLNPTKISLSVKARGEAIALLNEALADLSDLYSQAKQAHWNVRGKKFYQLHLLFDQAAGSVEGHIDTVAERVTQLGGYAEGTVRMAAKNSRLPEWPVNLDAEEEFVAAITDRFAITANALRAAIDAAAKVGDADTADLFTGVSRDLDKSLWFLEASK